MSHNIPDQAIALDGRKVLRADRTQDSAHKMLNFWRWELSTTLSACREFDSVFVVAVYIQRKEYPGQCAYKYSWQREERDVNTNSTKDMWQPNQNVTGYKSRGAPSCVVPCYRTSWTQFIILCSRLSPQQRLSCEVYSASRGPALSLTTKKKNPAEIEYKLGCWSRSYSC